MIENFKDVMSEIPTSVGVITCKDIDKVIGCTISSIISVSVELNDEKLLFALKKTSHIGEIIKEKSSFSLSILSEHQAEIATSAGGLLKHLDLDLFLQERIKPDSQGNLFIQDSKIQFSLILDEIIDANSSDIFLCNVLTAHVSLDDGKNPLLYYRRSFRKVNGLAN